jgi:foldase protein PrsA
VKLTPAIKDETNKQLELIKKALENQQEKASNDIEEVLEKHGFNSEQLRKFIERELLVDNALEDRIKDIEFDFVSVNHVLVGLEVQQPPSPDGKQQPPTKRSDEEAKKRAQEVFKKLQETKGDFKTIAKEYSDDPGSKDMEGKYEGDVSQFVKEFKDAALTLPIGKISDPVKTEFGYHVMRVNERKKMKVGQASEDIKETYKGNVFAELQDKELNFQLKVPPAKQPAPTPEQTPPAPTPEQSNQPNSPPAPSANPPQQQAPQPPAPPKP